MNRTELESDQPIHILLLRVLSLPRFSVHCCHSQAARATPSNHTQGYASCVYEGTLIVPCWPCLPNVLCETDVPCTSVAVGVSVHVSAVLELVANSILPSQHGTMPNQHSTVPSQQKSTLVTP